MILNKLERTVSKPVIAFAFVSISFTPVGAIAQSGSGSEAGPAPSAAAPTASPSEAAPSGSAAPAETGAPAPPKKLDKATLLDAKRAYTAGELSYQAGDYKSAILNFRDAQAHVPSPHAAYWLALSLKADGQIPEAIAQFEALLASPNASKIGDKKLTEARTVLEAIKKTPGTLSVTTDPPGASVAVDNDVRSGVTPLSVEMVPGKHTLTISIVGCQSMEIELEMPPGSKGEQAFKLEKNPEPVVAPTPTAPVVEEAPKAPPPAAPPPVLRSNVPAYVLFGMAGAGVITGTVFGVMALSDQSKFDARPTNDAADRAERDALGADIAFGAAITLGLAGTAYLLAPEVVLTKKTGAVAPRRLALTPYAGAHSAGASARWAF